ncbi:FAD-dependent oxidoreductase [Dactylosporangium sp. NPDC049525]|uniref:FAD-dependent oxidoreductase n=1 Tax=Dactylosporangium sp. NPDC049525 TaxID=3154730 RepID=UPI0034286C99
MRLTREQLLKLMGAAAVGPVAAAIDPSPAEAQQRHDEHVIRRDVCVIGGGSSGTYTAVRLRDLGRSVVVVEAKDRLGGHTETYQDPATGGTVDIGVIVFEDDPLVHAYFDRFGIALAPLTGAPGPTRYVDFRTGRPVDYTPHPPTALPAYYDLISQYGPIDTVLDPPNPVPRDLVAPFADFVAKYDLGSVVPVVFGYGQGLGNILDLPALYSINTVGQGVVRNILNNSFLTTAAHDNSLLYERAAGFLGPDVLLNSQVLRVDRSSSGVRVRISTPRGPRLIVADRLVVAIPPLPRNLAGFDLDAAERSLFGQFISGAYYTGVVRLSGLPAGLSLSDAAAGTPFNLPRLPGLYGVGPTGIPGLYNVKFGSPSLLPEALVRRSIRAEIERVAAAGTYPVVFEDFAVFSGHVPFALHVPPQAIAAGFYRRLQALQGRNRTYYPSAAFHSHNSSRIWAGVELLLPSIAS